MNAFQKMLYEALFSLTKEGEVFYFQDFTLDGKVYRIFNYRLASYTEFMKPGALECRGVMFEVNGDEAVRLASLPIAKFFNLNENPSTMGLDLTQVVGIEEKADGSLMSTYLHNGELRLKSKGSLFSDQALAAMKWLDRHANEAFKADLLTLTRHDNTINLEWCSPEHRIVLGYMEPTLKVLNIRVNESGVYHPMTSAWVPYSVQNVQVDDPVAFVASIPSMTDIEGFVLLMANGQRIKIKTEWYLSLHHAKDSVNNPRRLFECILEEGVDDLRSMFSADPLAMRLIDEMQIKVNHLYNNMVKMVEDYYVENKDLSRKDYAIKAQVHFKDTLYFGLAMEKYINRPFSYKEFLKGKWRDLGLKDTSLSDE